jgi:hypothetical protein
VRCRKQGECRMAELLGGRRAPVSGRVRGDSPDITRIPLAVEVKSRKRLPGWLEEALKRAETSARDRQLPVAVLHQDRRRYADCLVVLRLKDFVGYVNGGVE